MLVVVDYFFRFFKLSFSGIA